MVQEGSRVRLRPESRLAQRHPEMAQAVGVVGSIVRGAALGSGSTMHVRFKALNLVAMNVPSGEVEAVDHLDPEMQEG